VKKKVHVYNVITSCSVT